MWGQCERRRALIDSFDGDIARVHVLFKNVWALVDRHHMQFICTSIPLEELKAEVMYLVVHAGQHLESGHFQFLDMYENPTGGKLVRFTEFDFPIRRISGVMMGDAPSKTNKRKLMCPCCSEELIFDGIKLMRT